VEGTRSLFPHLVNAGKYLSAFSVMIFGYIHKDDMTSLVHALWVASFILATIYQFTWDILVDWGLSKTSFFLDDNSRLLPRKLYGAFIPLDLVLRFAWMMSLIPAKTVDTAVRPFGDDLQTLLMPFLAAAEVARRMGWLLVRVENEFNCKKQEEEMEVTLLGTREEEEETDGNEEAEKESETKKWLLVELSFSVFVIGSITVLAYVSK
jgi:hypothetical protein